MNLIKIRQISCDGYLPSGQKWVGWNEEIVDLLRMCSVQRILVLIIWSALRWQLLGLFLLVVVCRMDWRLTFRWDDLSNWQHDWKLQSVVVPAWVPLVCSILPRLIRPSLLLRQGNQSVIPFAIPLWIDQQYVTSSLKLHLLVATYVVRWFLEKVAFFDVSCFTQF